MPELFSNHVLLLRAALLKGREARIAWDEWKSANVLDLVDTESYGLLPQVYKNLREQGVADSQAKKLKGIYRHTWCKNKVLIEQMIPLIQRLEMLGIPTMILNGASIVTTYSKDFGLLPLTKVDVVIPKHGAAEVMKCSRQLGWSSWEMDPEKTLATKGAILLKNPTGQYCQLHCHVLENFSQPKADQYFWDHVTESKWKEVKIASLAPRAYVLKLLIDGAGPKKEISPGWVAGVYRLLSSYQSDIDWDELLDQVQFLSLTLPFKRHVQHLVDVLNPGLSPTLLKRIERLSSTKMEELEYAAMVKKRPEEGGLLSRLSIHWCHYGRTEGNGSFIKRVLGFVGYLQKIWHIDHLWQIPFYGMLRSVRRIVREGFV